MAYTDPLPVVQPPATPVPFALLLDDGTECHLRNGGAWGGRDDGLIPAYGCNSSDNIAVLEAANAPPIDRSQPLWTVKVSSFGANLHYPPPQTHGVTTAWFAGN